MIREWKISEQEKLGISRYFSDPAITTVLMI
ncbi:hypothetical protein ACPDXS_000040 [Vibrio cholerae]|nr:hypothetical protein [Vibrio cholerae]EGQ7704535.1 hypothetical protein [Vibrio cholerae]EGR1091219.1 hypothetical protein [Vibrio cholerae]EHK7541285.1 hypothetical protein [Vibrio cholerae]EJL6507015.1 hypothetical protein [Vibrio cholerae]